MKHKVLVLALGLILVAAACNKSSNQTSSSDQSSVTPTPSPTETPPPSETPTPSPTPTPTPNPTPSQMSATAEIDITDSGFSPSTVTINKGATVIFVNKGSKPHWPASNPHPVHTDLAGFDALKGIAPGGSYSFTFTKVGTWGFHDHLNPSNGGKVIVQ